ncbi:BPSS1780 family membrane protein [Glaciimonas sp. CA11.2]|uniref:BPSS1780 family membrane protein n=1 Tax=unclassified Glaciimonas TaxID=2644401 RepID=UPI002AB46F17|nr:MULTISPECIES: BPSS1780 family membrane protein [unclassified Glaciimonas]MDY7545441.1 BPSS1780 family membrane protein [Glaciimonas sp. CA11.2]MEB0013335.1 BPSS1780 family membrane protein [Glaciimonas sp. Cout2]MEB0082754.1 BPSS1780 family membrane protein [Glaciimonas sp. Gout2]MEB0161944.1 BPSS1780 family membrane protein [Glaciimonas sp. CA11.2]
MEKLPAKTGWIWVKSGFALFRKQPAEISTLFLAYMFLMLAVGIVPVLGQLLPLILIPVFSMAFMQACVQIENDKRVFPNLLLTGFRSPAVKNLLLLGCLYLLAAMIAIGASALIDGGVFWEAMTGQIPLDAKTAQESNMTLAMMFSAAVYVPFAMGFWYAAPLIAWQKMSVFKAIFYSFFAVQRETKAFMVYGLSWVVFGVLFPAIISVIVALLVGNASITLMVLLPLSILLTVVMYCSFYPTYKQVFGEPEPSEK